MKLGKALATGVAEERPLDRDLEVELPEGLRDEELRDTEASASEEVPAAR
ncbi:hypothetical protein [Streptomyces sp. NPDC056479]